MSDDVRSPERQAAARLRIERALAHLQEAQAQVGRALEQLSPIIGALPAYSKGHKLYDQVRAYWYKVSELRQEPKAGKLGLDRPPLPEEMR